MSVCLISCFPAHTSIPLSTRLSIAEYKHIKTAAARRARGPKEPCVLPTQALAPYPPSAPLPSLSLRPLSPLSLPSQLINLSSPISLSHPGPPLPPPDPLSLTHPPSLTPNPLSPSLPLSLSPSLSLSCCIASMWAPRAP